MKTKFLISLMAAAMVFAAAGCGDKDFSVNSSKPVTQETGELKINYALGDLIKLGKYKGISLTGSSVAVTDAEVTARMAVNANSFKDTGFSKDAGVEVKEGDVVNLNFEGFIDGAAESTESATAENFVLGLGSNSFIPGFEAQLIGHSIGEEFDINVTFPENYGAADMAGKPARFAIKLNGVVTDKDVAANTEYKTTAEWREAVKAELQKEKENTNKSTLKSEGMNKVLSYSLAKRFPESLVSAYKDMLVNDLYMPYAEQMGITYEELQEQFGLTEERILQEVQSSILSDMAVAAIAKKEGITVTAEELKELKASKIGEGLAYKDEADYNAQNGDDKLILELLDGKVRDFIVENATITVSDAAVTDAVMSESDDIEVSEDEALAEEVDAESVSDEE